MLQLQKADVEHDARASMGAAGLTNGIGELLLVPLELAAELRLAGLLGAGVRGGLVRGGSNRQGGRGYGGGVRP
jgi:hypothetical protein